MSEHLPSSKRRRQTGASPKRTRFLQGMICLVVPGGAGSDAIGFKQQEVIERLLEEHGGVTAARYSDRLTHIASNLRYEDLCRVLKVRGISLHVHLVTVSYLHACFKQERLLDETGFRLHRPEDRQHLQWQQQQHPQQTQEDERLLRLDDSSQMNLLPSDDLAPLSPRRMEETLPSKESPNGPSLRSIPIARDEEEEELTVTRRAFTSVDTHEVDITTHHDVTAQSPPSLSLSYLPDADAMSTVNTSSSSSDGRGSVFRYAPGRPDQYRSADLFGNAALVAEFDRLLDIYKALGDEIRAMHYSNVVRELENLSFKLTDVSQLQDVPHFGKKTLERVAEFLRTGKLSLREALEADEKVRAIRELTSIHGVGRVTAAKWYHLGLRTVGDVRQRAGQLVLTRTQALGLQYWGDLQKQIPREEVAEMEKIVRDAALAVCSKTAHVQACGSYRRGKALVGDVDIVFTDVDGTADPDRELPLLVSELKRSGFIIADLEHPEDRDHHGKSTSSFFGICQVRPDLPVRRIDILSVQIASWIPFRLQWTGGTYFNRLVKRFAAQQGMHLSDKGLWRNAKKDEGGYLLSGEFVPLRTERNLFEAVGIPYTPPELRNP